MTAKQNDYSQERQQAAGQAIMNFDAVAQGWRDMQPQLVGVSIRCPRAVGDDYLMTLRAVTSEGNPVVAFHGGFNLLELWLGAWNRYKNQSLTWRDDEWER